jgi:hypothetical protein
MWGEQWVCDCGWSNITLRSACRNCGATQRDDHRHEGHGEIMANVAAQNDIEARIAAKSREIEATGLCKWGYRTTDEIEKAE